MTATTPRIGTRVFGRSHTREYAIRRDRTQWRLAYVELAIVGDTRVSWIVGPPGAKDTAWNVTKIKKRDWPGPYYLTWEDVEKAQWANDNAYRIGEAVRRLGGGDFDRLRTIADLLGEPACAFETGPGVTPLPPERQPK